MKKTIAVVFFILVLAFIWSQSVLSPQKSSAESHFVLNIIRPVLELFAGKGKVTGNMVRKIAHYTEFAFLGLFTVMILYKENRARFTRILISALICLVAAFLDESIQIFSHRGPAIPDVWIDLSGAVVGIITGLFV